MRLVELLALGPLDHQYNIGPLINNMITTRDNTIRIISNINLPVEIKEIIYSYISDTFIRVIFKNTKIFLD